MRVWWRTRSGRGVGGVRVQQWMLCHEAAPQALVVLRSAISAAVLYRGCMCTVELLGATPVGCPPGEVFGVGCSSFRSFVAAQPL